MYMLTVTMHTFFQVGVTQCTTTTCTITVCIITLGVGMYPLAGDGVILRGVGLIMDTVAGDRGTDTVAGVIQVGAIQDGVTQDGAAVVVVAIIPAMVVA